MRQEHLSGGTCSTGATATGTRSNALWGKGRRRFPLLVFAFVVVAASVVAGSTAAGPPPPSRPVSCPTAFGTRPRRTRADTFHVVIQTTDASQLDALGATVRNAQKKHPGNAKGLTKKFKLIDSATAEVTGDQIADIAAATGVVSVTEDAPIQATAYGNLQNWPASVGAQWGDPPRRTEFPTIAIVDSGVEARSDFGRRLIRQVDFTTTGDELLGRRIRARHARRRPRRRRRRTASRASSRGPTSCRSTSSTTPATAR